ncbi:uncharacterized protein [Anabrus simplex]|uniref:uncharacterized protein n=1 Tax=Anabrus simplex TaxID=316456 RepID=UPI0035A28100
MKTGRKTSILWSYFTYINDNVAKCDLCDRKLSYKSTTTNLRKHIERKHNVNSYKPREGVTYILSHPDMKNGELCGELVEADENNYVERGDSDAETGVADTGVTHDSNYDHKYASEGGLTIVMPEQSMQPGSSCNFEESVKYHRDRAVKVSKREGDSEKITQKVNCSSAGVKSEDEFDIAGKKLSYDLRTMNQQQHVIAEKLVSDVVYYAKLGKLNENSSIRVG